jgi:hypothetical protein
VPAAEVHHAGFAEAVLPDMMDSAA